MYLIITLILFGSSITKILSHSSSLLPSSLSSSSGSFSHVVLPSLNSPPRISILSHNFHSDTIEIPSNDNLILRCVGHKPMIWILPDNHHPYDSSHEYGSINITQSCSDSRPEHELNRCKTEIHITEIKFGMTGQYVCLYNQTKSNAIQLNFPNQTIAVTSINFHQSKESQIVEQNIRDSVYIFVNDEENLIVPYEGVTEFFILAVFQSQPATIPCKSTISGTKVTLWKTNIKDNVESEILPDPNLGISFNPKKGFFFESPRWDSDSSNMQCKFEYKGHVGKTMVTVHWSILPDELYPMIDDSGARNAYHNSTFTLICVVHIEIGVIIVIDWDVPNASKNNQTNKRIVKSDVESHRTSIDNSSYDMISVNLTVHNALESDSGDYRCNVTDGKGRIFTTVKRVNVFDRNVQPTINLSSKIDLRHPLEFVVGDNIELTIIANAVPDISRFDLNWYHHNSLLDFSSNRIQTSIFSDHSTHITLFIADVKASDSGFYTLVANSSSVIKNITAEIIVSGVPEVVLEYVKPNYVANESFSVLCKAFSHPLGAVWWSWIDCNTSVNCFDSSSSLDGGKIFRNDDVRWKNLTECLDDRETDEEEEFCSRIYPSPYPKYMNASLLNINNANRTGIFRCSSINKHDIVKHYQTPVIVTEDLDGLFNVIQSPEEPTTNDTVRLTCRASVYTYWKVYWKTDDKAVAGQRFDNSSYSVSSTIVLSNAKPEDSALYKCEALSRLSTHSEHKETYLIVKNVSLPSFVDTNLKNNVIKMEIHSKFELRCYVSGRPRPQLQWFRDGEPFDTTLDSRVQIKDHGQKIVFTRLLEKDSGKYDCRGHNRGGRIGRTAYLQVHDDDFASFTISELIIYSLFFILALAILVISVFIGRKLHQDRLRKRELEMFSQAMFENGQMEMFNPDMPLDEQIDLLPYDSRYEFPKENLRLGRTLGQGAFGRVVKAEAFGLEGYVDEPKVVAVKMLKERANSDHRKALMAELKILIHLGRHVNIVNLLGAVTRNIAKGELLVLVEYCEFGNLRDFLLANRDNFHNEMHPSCGNGEYQNVPSSKGNLEYQNSWKNGNQTAFSNHNYVSGTASVALTNSSIKKTQKPLYSTDLICYSFQCSRGMEYLAQRKLIHRDLAARNVLLDANYIVKICDFGLAKDVYRDDNYVKQNSGPLPIKWMAIESMTDKVFTSKSDVWSFGILLWEIFTLGKNPYPGIEINEEFYQKLKAGYRMEKPDYANDLLYELMLKCWDPSPTVRPDFEVISHIIGEMLPPERRKEFIDMNSVFEEMNQELLRNDYMKMASMTADENGNCYNMKDASELLNGTGDDYLQMHDDRKMFVSGNGEHIQMDTLNNKQPYV